MWQPDSTAHVLHCPKAAAWPHALPVCPRNTCTGLAIGSPGGSYTSVSLSWSVQVLTGNRLATSSFNN